jgi:ADP-glucose pyrophosphorylase
VDDTDLPATFAACGFKGDAVTRFCVVSPGCIIEEGAIVEHSILSPGVYIGKGAVVRRSILLHRVRVSEGCHLEKVIVDEDVTIPQGEQIGVDLERDRKRFTVTERGVVIVPVGVAF